jgi:glutamine synthetase adenylyltransferase
MNDPFKLGGLVAVALLGATAMGVAFLLARDPELLKRLVKQGALTYHKAAAILAEAREELGDIMAEALHQAEEELREVDSAETVSATESGRKEASAS